MRMDFQNGYSQKKKWHEIIRIAEARVDSTSMFYLVDENYDFIPLVKDFMDMIQTKAGRSISPNTSRNYCYMLWYFIVFLRMKKLEILDLDGKPEILVKFKSWLMNPYRFYENVEVISPASNEDYNGEKLSTTTINTIIDRVSSLYLWLKASHKIDDNPVIYKTVANSGSLKDINPLSHIRNNSVIRKNILKSRPEKALLKTINEKDFKAFLSSMNSLRDKIIALLLKEGGLRASELLGIHLEDIDFAEQAVWIRFRPDNINNARAKAGYGRDRFVHLPGDLVTLIDRYISSEWIDSNANNDFLFVVINSNNPEHTGRPMTKSTLDSLFKYHGKKTGVKIHPHQLRHTHVTELVREYLRRGEPINWEYISKRLGHSSVTTTMDIYAHLNNEDYKKEYEKLKSYRKTP